jgi:hypothetical protein
MPRALLVGTNYPGTSYSLRGCENDTKLLHLLLSAEYGYKDEVLVLADSMPFKATRGNILAGIAWLYSDAKVADFRGEEGLKAAVSSSSRSIPIMGIPLSNPLKLVGSLASGNSRFVLPVPPVSSVLPVSPVTSIPTVAEKLVKKIFALIEELRNLLRGNQDPAARAVLDAFESFPLEHLTSIRDVVHSINPLVIMDEKLPNLGIFDGSPALPLESSSVESLPVPENVALPSSNPLSDLMSKLNNLGSISQKVNRVTDVTGPLKALMNITEAISNTQAVLLSNLPALIALQSSLEESVLEESVQNTQTVQVDKEDSASTSEERTDTIDIHLSPRDNERYVFSFSGHGTQVTDENGEEKDGLDEVICPLDFETTGPITDDLLHQLLVAHLPESSKLTVVLDCCNSGSGLDLPLEVKKSFFGNVSLKGDHALETGSVCLISGCRDNQTSADVRRNGQEFGACTYSLTQILRTNKQEKYKNLQDDLRNYIKKQKFSGQEPCLSFSRRESLDARVQF